MLTLATAFVADGLSAITRDTTMSEKQYDNSNQLGLWKVSEEGRSGYYSGYGDFDGEKAHDAYLIVNRRKESGRGAFATLIWRTSDGWAKPVDIWNNEGKLGGKMEGFWVNVYKNDVEEGSKRPALSVKFKPMEAVAAAAPAKDTYEEIPF